LASAPATSVSIPSSLNFSIKNFNDFSSSSLICKKDVFSVSLQLSCTTWAKPSAVVFRLSYNAFNFSFVSNNLFSSSVSCAVKGENILLSVLPI
jgi:hypothetical protein